MLALYFQIFSKKSYFIHTRFLRNSVSQVELFAHRRTANSRARAGIQSRQSDSAQAPLVDTVFSFPTCRDVTNVTKEKECPVTETLVKQHRQRDRRICHETRF